VTDVWSQGATGRENIFAETGREGGTGEGRDFANGWGPSGGGLSLWAWRASLAAGGCRLERRTFAKRRIFVSPAGYSPKIHPPGKI